MSQPLRGYGSFIMWFTVAFFSIPIAVFLMYRGITKYGKNGKTKIIWAIVLILIPIILVVIEIRGVKQIDQELIGTYYSDNDTLLLNKDKTFALKSTTSLLIGQWDLEAEDKLIVTLNKDGKKFIDMGLTYIDGLPCLETDPYHLDKIESKRYAKK
jgi:hypothetical protein